MGTWRGWGGVEGGEGREEGGSGEGCVLESEVVVVVVELDFGGQLSSLDLARKLTVLIDDNFNTLIEKLLIVNYSLQIIINIFHMFNIFRSIRRWRVFGNRVLRG